MYTKAILVLDLLEEAGFPSRLAGGCVRDRLLGITPDDYDIATKALPDDVICVLTDNGINVVPTGIDHGTVSAVFGSRVIEITTLRKDVTPMGRRAIVEFGDVSFKEDASRRDFTVNAMFEDRNQKIYDYFGGEDDIKNKRLRFVGDASLRIKEDYLRILRFFRFWAKLGFTPLEEEIQKITIHKEGLRCISQERITSEIKKIFSYPDILPVLESMQGTGVFQEVFKGFNISGDDVHSLNELASTTNKPEFLYIFRFSYIVKQSLDSHLLSLKEVETRLKNLKLSNLEVQRIKFFSGFESELLSLKANDQASLMDFIDELENDLRAEFCKDFIDYLAFCINDKTLLPLISKIEEVELSYKEIRKATLPINGSDIKKEFNLKTERQIGVILTYLKTQFRLLNWKTYKEGINLVKTKFFQ